MEGDLHFAAVLLVEPLGLDAGLVDLQEADIFALGPGVSFAGGLGWGGHSGYSL